MTDSEFKNVSMADAKTDESANKLRSEVLPALVARAAFAGIYLNPDSFGLLPKKGYAIVEVDPGQRTAFEEMLRDQQLRRVNASENSDRFIIDLASLITGCEQRKEREVQEALGSTRIHADVESGRRTQKTLEALIRGPQGRIC